MKLTTEGLCPLDLPEPNAIDHSKMDSLDSIAFGWEYDNFASKIIAMSNVSISSEEHEVTLWTAMAVSKSRI